MGGHIDAYLDLASLYSYLTLAYLQKNRGLLAAHDVTIEFHPVFLGGINVGSGNKPPWSLPAKAVYGRFDSARSKNYHGLTSIQTPAFFPPLTLLPQRALGYIKSVYPSKTYETTFLHLFQNLWTAPNQQDITQPTILKSVLSTSTLFTESEIDTIITKAGEKEWKDKLLDTTQKVLDQGAFGAPWFWVKNGEGVAEPFFGSDRFHFMWVFLGIPHQPIEILPPKEEVKSKL